MVFQIKSKLDIQAKPRFFKAGGKAHFHVLIHLDGPPAQLDTVSRVVYKLHPSFRERERISTDRDTKFETAVWTYGQFDMSADVYFNDGTPMTTVEGRLEFSVPASLVPTNPYDDLQRAEALLKENQQLLKKLM